MTPLASSRTQQLPRHSLGMELLVASVAILFAISSWAHAQDGAHLSWVVTPDQVLASNDEDPDSAPLPRLVPPQSPEPDVPDESSTTAETDTTDANASDDDRLKKLEEELNKLKAAVEGGADDKEEKVEDKEEKYPGLPTGKFTMELQADAYTFGQDAANVATVGNIPNGTAFRRARVGWTGEWELTEYRIEFDFAQSGRPSFLDVWAGLQEVPHVRNVRVGHYFEPFSFERMTSNRFNTFLERSLLDSFFVPARNTGFGFSTYTDDERLALSLGLFAEDSDNFGDDVGFERGEALTTRITGLPFWSDDGRHYVHLGAAASFRNPDADEVRYATQPEARLGAANPNVPFFVDTGTFAAEQDLRGGLEFAWIYGPFSVQSEYMCASADRVADSDVFFDGVYVQTSLFLTGEHRPYLPSAYGGGAIGRVIPNYNACIASRSGSHGCGWGAWEVATRVSYLDGNDEDILGRRLTDVTFGLNWYMTPYLRLMTNYIHAFLDDPTIGESDADILGARIQYDF